MKLSIHMERALMHQAEAALKGWALIGSNIHTVSKQALARRGLLDSDSVPTSEGWNLVEKLFRQRGLGGDVARANCIRQETEAST